MKDFLKLIISIAICEGVGVLGSFLTIPSVLENGTSPSWYQMLNKPLFNPPSFVFGPVWTTLFLLMGISMYLVWSKGIKKKNVKNALIFFGAQLMFNFLWSFLFFYLHNPLLAFVDIIILWIFILLTIIKFYKISKPAAYLLIPYILWVSFASILNFFIIVLNP